MLFIKFVVIFFLSSVVADYLYAFLGFLLVKTRRFHRTGLRMLAMSMFVPSRLVSHNCKLDWPDCLCGNWRCDKFNDCHCE